MSGILYSPALLLTLVHHCDSSPRSKSQKFIWMQKLYNAKGGKQHQRMHIYKKTTHVSNHTLALTVSTEIYCTLEMDVQQKRQGKKKWMRLRFQQEDVEVVDVLKNQNAVT